jgi:hypothetical protein
MEHPPASLAATALDPRSDRGPDHVAAVSSGRTELRAVVPGETVADRYVAPGGWRRALLGFLIGLLAGGIVALLLPRDDGPRRRDLRVTELPGTSPARPAPSASAPGAVPRA